MLELSPPSEFANETERTVSTGGQFCRLYNIARPLGVIQAVTPRMQTMSIPRIVCVLAGGFFLFAVSRGVALLTDRTPHPQLQVTPTEVDLGAVSLGQAVERTLLIRNSGTARLLITDVKSTCQCTVADLPSRAIAPGRLAELKVTFDARSADPKSQRVTIQSNDPDAPTHIIKLQAKAVVATQP